MQKSSQISLKTSVHYSFHFSGAVHTVVSITMCFWSRVKFRCKHYSKRKYDSAFCAKGRETGTYCSRWLQMEARDSPQEDALYCDRCLIELMDQINARKNEEKAVEEAEEVAEKKGRKKGKARKKEKACKG